MQKKTPGLPAEDEIAEQRLRVEGQQSVIEVKKGKLSGGHARMTNAGAQMSNEKICLVSRLSALQVSLQLMSSRTLPVLPDAHGHFGKYGGMFVPETLMAALTELSDHYEKAKADPAFHKELDGLLHEYVRRPTPLYFAENLFKGEARWVEVSARQGTADFVTLTPRQVISPTPYALFSLKTTYSPSGGNRGTEEIAARSDHTHFGQAWVADLAGAAGLRYLSIKSGSFSMNPVQKYLMRHHHTRNGLPVSFHPGKRNL